jgi:hypothetical protein
MPRHCGTLWVGACENCSRRSPPTGLVARLASGIGNSRRLPKRARIFSLQIECRRRKQEHTSMCPHSDCDRRPHVQRPTNSRFRLLRYRGLNMLAVSLSAPDPYGHAVRAHLTPPHALVLW